MLRVGVVFEGNLTDGGGFQTQISTLQNLHNSTYADFVFFVFSSKNQEILKKYGIECHVVPNTILAKIFKVLHKSSLLYDLFFKLGILTSFEKTLKKYEIHLCYFLSPSPEAYYLKQHNYIFTMWDTSHREFMEFPEVNFKGVFERREKFYSAVLKKAVAIISDSQYAKENLIRYYGLNRERIYPCSFLPSVNAYQKQEIDIFSKYKIVKQEYIYYPAQFWAHKNHVYIIDTLRILKDKGYNIKAVFSGSNKGNLDHVLNYAKKQGVDHLIKYIGFAPNEEIYSLFYNSIALVMPTYFGTTNIPPLEAFAIGTPVIYSNLPDLREQTQDAALYCDLNNPSTLANHIIKLRNDVDLRTSLINLGKDRLVSLQEIKIDDILKNIIETYKTRFLTFSSIFDDIK